MSAYSVLFLLIISALGLRNNGANSIAKQVMSSTLTPGSSDHLQVKQSCDSLSLENHGPIQGEEASSAAVMLYLLSSEPQLDPQHRLNFTTSYSLSTSPESCALGSAFALHRESAISATGCYSSTNNLPTNVSLLLIEGLLTYSDYYCDWKNSAIIEEYPLSTCEAATATTKSDTTAMLEKDGNYYLVLSNGGESSFTQTQINLYLSMTGYMLNTSDILDTCTALTGESCDTDVHEFDDYYAVIVIGPPEDDTMWQQYIETELYCNHQVDSDVDASDSEVSPAPSSMKNPERSSRTTPSPRATPPGEDVTTPSESDGTLPPWGYGAISTGGGVIVLVPIIVIPVIIKIRRKKRRAKQVNVAREPSLHEEEQRNQRHLLSNPPPSYGELFDHKVGRPRGGTGERGGRGNSDGDEVTKPRLCQSEGALGQAPERANHENCDVPVDFAAAALL